MPPMGYGWKDGPRVAPPQERNMAGAAVAGSRQADGSFHPIWSRLRSPLRMLIVIAIRVTLDGPAAITTTGPQRPPPHPQEAHSEIT